MECEKCDVAMELRRASTGAPYRYDLGGGFDLAGIDVYRCPRCGGESPVLPRIRQLHALMAGILAAQLAPLSGGQIKFLRKHAGFSAKHFASLLGIDPSYLSRVENEKRGHETLGEAADRLARLVASETESARTALMRIAEQRLKIRKPLQRMPGRLRLVDGRIWKAESNNVA